MALNHRPFRDNPLHSRIQVGDRIQRHYRSDYPTRLKDRWGTVAGPAFRSSQGDWYVPIRWDGSHRSEAVHIQKIRWPLPPEEGAIA